MKGKKTNIFHGNQYVESFVCDGKRYTKEQARRIKRRRFFRKVKIAILIMITIYGWSVLIRLVLPKEIIVIEEKKVIIDNLIEKVKSIKSETINDLRSCESAGYKEDDGIIIFDSNSKASIGTFQFQKSTVIHYYKTLYGKDITGKESVLIALDDSKSARLAEDIIFGTKDGYTNWKNCAIKKNIKQSVDIVNKLLK